MIKKQGKNLNLHLKRVFRDKKKLLKFNFNSFFLDIY